MMQCECTIPEGGFCERHGIYKIPEWVRLCNTRADYRKAWDDGRGPGQPRTTVDQKRGGPGTELKQIIAAWQKRFPLFDLSPGKGCSCASTAKWMDQLGPDGCKKNIDKILDKLEEEARKRKLTVPFRRTVAKMLVKQAIRRARRKDKTRQNPTSEMTDMRRLSHKEQMAKLPPVITQAKGAKPAKPRGLGDLIEGALSKVGITHERVDAWLGRPCSCAERKERLNRLFSWARTIEETPPEEAAAKVEEIFNS